jgi:hypothetical protein
MVNPRRLGDRTHGTRSRSLYRHFIANEGWRRIRRERIMTARQIAIGRIIFTPAACAPAQVSRRARVCFDTVGAARR